MKPTDSAPSSRNYHHGDLYQSLLLMATEMITEGGTENLSMRKLADRVGVSRTAPYHHFKDKNVLLCAIAEQGFERVEKLLLEARTQEKAVSLTAAFTEYVHTYIELAHQHREQYDLMFGREIWRNGTPTASLQNRSRQHFKSWLNWIEHLSDQNVIHSGDSTLRTAQVCWATLHGLCRLLNDGIYTEQSHLKEMVDTAVNMMLKDA
ncbi:TetR/AcrR family transcriptional regulator [Amphritea japonica]|uniref:TetR family transcriptional regulator n=1 Tax=Amphritea japonica ATCC BAA-1530 TaxID=1278309 RepID=A0A7R6PPT4_9GAMM|nr:TetR/AcrR family transcriptional regulator [Amphritea japonica]BBB27298.1 TetR family transcriptional regulator [Amphritea japonica ATCC BAA-1530]